MHKSYHLIVDTPTLKKKRHHFIFNCEGQMIDGSIDRWLQQKLEDHFWNHGQNKPTRFSIVEYGSIVGELVEIKL